MKKKWSLFLMVLLLPLKMIQAASAVKTNIESLRDPFSKPDKFADLSANPRLTDLERFPLEQLDVVGIITGPKKQKVLVSTPQKKTILAQVGDKIGTKQGRIQKIMDKSIIVSEKMISPLGKESYSKIERKLISVSELQNRQGGRL